MAEAPLRLTDEARIIAWRSERARHAEAARQERLAAAALDREDRLARFEAEKEQRIAETRRQRDEEAAAQAALKRQEARARLAGLEDLTFAAADLRRDQRLRNRLALTRFIGLTLVPALLVTLALLLFADPVYQARLTAVPGPPGSGADMRDLAGFQAEARVAGLDLPTPPQAEPEPAWLALLRGSLAGSQPVSARYDPRRGLITITATAPDPDLAMRGLALALDGPQSMTLISAPNEPTEITAARLAKASLFILAALMLVYGFFRVFVSSFVYYGRV
jgi:hypothetical protein